MEGYLGKDHDLLIVGTESLKHSVPRKRFKYFPLGIFFSVDIILKASKGKTNLGEALGKNED